MSDPASKEIPNLATAFLDARGETVEDWDGLCGELADAITEPGDAIIHAEGEDWDYPWRYHMVPLIAGLIHDAWCEGPALPLAEWLTKMFADATVTVALHGDDIYAGPADAFCRAGARGEETTFMNTENDKQPETAVRCTSVVGDDEKRRANKEWEEGPEWAFLQWCDKRGVWPRLTHQEVFLAGWEAARRSHEGSSPTAKLTDAP